jgi:glycosyltransferase involved in cell wall biosynthesis
MNHVFLSIITPTYNRGHLLPRCFDSLCAQTDKDFEWIIVNDGSNDDTDALDSNFDDSNFPIVYLKKENGGKHTALNASHSHIHGHYTMILDSDDYLTETAVAQIKKGWMPYADQGSIGIATFLKGSSQNTPNCTAPTPNIPVDILRYKRNIIHSSDCCEVIRTDLFLKYPFPTFEGERFIAECALWNRVALTHKCVYINKVIYICEYLEGGLTSSGRAMRIRNPRGGMFTSHLRMGSNNFFKQRIKYGLLYCCYGFFAGFPFLKILKNTKYKLLASFCILPGFVMYKLWKKKYS